MLFRWFVGLGMEDAAWDHSTYTQNRDRLIDHDAVRALFAGVMQQAEDAKLLSCEHFSVDGTLIRAWASIKSFVPKDGPPPDKGGSKSNPEVDFKRQNAATPRMRARPIRTRSSLPSRRRPKRCPPTGDMC
ncbi:MAG: transposase [Burkholderiaceae bacterium]